MMPRRVLGLALVLAAGAAVSAEAATTEIEGTVTARRAGAVQVSFGPRAGVGPAVGDAVTFSTEIDGIRVDAGQGEVSDVEAASIWVRVSRGRPSLGNTAVIRVTGTPVPPQPSSRQPTPANTGSSGPANETLAPRQIEGVGELLLPGYMTPRVIKPGPFWTVRGAVSKDSPRGPDGILLEGKPDDPGADHVSPLVVLRLVQHGPQGRAGPGSRGSKARERAERAMIEL